MTTKALVTHGARAPFWTNHMPASRSLLLCMALLTTTPLCATADETAAYAAYRQADYQRAFTLLKERLRDPEPEVHFLLGEMYRHGRGIAQDQVQAVSWYEKAADRGHAGALYVLTELYDKGEGVKQDHAQARNLATRAAALGYSKAALYMGDTYARGIDVTPDYRQAYVWFGVASLDGDAIGSLNQAQLARYLSPEDRSDAEQELDKYLRQRAARAARKQWSEPLPSGADRESNPVAAFATPASAPQFIWMYNAREAKVNGADFGNPSLFAGAPLDNPLPPAREHLQSTPPSPATAQNGVTDHQLRQVEPGQTLYAIAREIKAETQLELGVILASLRQANPTLAIDRGLQIGEWLQIPVFAQSALVRPFF